MEEKLKYVKVDLNNLDIAYAFQKREWPCEKDYKTFKHKAIYGDAKNISFIVYLKNKPIGITGVYDEEIDNTSLWLDWFCLDKIYRGKGYGKQILFDTIEYCRQFKDIEFFRIESNLSVDRESTNLYLKTMDFIEKYTIEDDENFNGVYICTKCLKERVSYVPWNNRYLGLNKHYKTLKTGDK